MTSDAVFADHPMCPYFVGEDANQRQQRAEEVAERHIRECSQDWIEFLDGRIDYKETAQLVSGYLDGEQFIRSAAFAKTLRAEFVEFCIDARLK